jgi:serine/threonine protein kinase
MKECPACKRCFPDEIGFCPHDGIETTPSLLGEPILDARYQLERRLGQGGMGVVFQARHVFLKTSHAIKVILPDLVGNDPNLVARFRQEALAAAAIRHQNIIAVTDFGVVRGTMPFLVMEFVKGKSLHDIMAQEGAMPPARAFELICPIGAGVAAAHRQNIVHRDLKPLNIMIQDVIPINEGVKILDFGLAKIKSGELLGSFVAAKTSGMMGSPFYMAPEQWSDEEPDARADIYSLGIILYQMLAGDVPFKGSSIPSIMKKHLTLPPPSFESMGVQLPPQIEDVVCHALEKELSARTPSVEALLNELKEAMNSASTLKSTTEAPAIDPNKTILSEPFTTSATLQAQQTSKTEPLLDFAGATSSSPLDEAAHQQSPALSDTYRREQEEKERIQREEIAREAEERRQAEEKDRLRREREERESQERQQHERYERMAQQAKELEERLALLANSVPPQIAVVDPEATQIQERAVATRPVGNNSFPGGPPANWQESQPFLGIGQDAKRSLGIGQDAKSSYVLFIAIPLLVVLLLAGGAITYLIIKSREVTGGTPTGSKTNGTTATATIKLDFIEIPGGTFQMGRDNGPLQERPAHTVSVNGFFLGRTEVTNAEYEEFVHDTNYQVPSHWRKGKPVFGQELWPVVNVSVDDAKAFAAWHSKRDAVSYRLPTEEEWEYAARGGNWDYLYPWGNDWADGKAVVKDGFPKAVGSLPDGKTRWGGLDMLGNVWEWTSTAMDLYSGNKQVEFPSQYKRWIVKRGGSFLSDPNDKHNPITATYRDFAPASTKNSTVGFRLVREGSTQH